MGESNQLAENPTGIISRALKKQPQEYIPPAPKNLFEGRARSQGIALDMPNVILRSSAISGLPRDRLIGLPLESDDKTRSLVINEFTRALKGGSSWAFIYSDSDNVKVGNNADRGIGDLAIRYGPAVIGQIIDRLKFNSNIRIIGFRSGDAADETGFLILNASNEDLDRIKREIKALSPQQTVFSVNGSEVPYEFSTSANLITADDPEIDPNYIKDTANLAKQGGNAYDLYKLVTRIVKGRVDLEKIVKDINRIPLERFIKGGIREAKQVLLERLGDSRISGPTLELALNIMAVLQHVDPNTFVRPKTAQGWQDLFEKLFPDKK
jgi:hypothetical protein